MVWGKIAFRLETSPFCSLLIQKESFEFYFRKIIFPFRGKILKIFFQNFFCQQMKKLVKNIELKNFLKRAEISLFQKIWIWEKCLSEWLNFIRIILITKQSFQQKIINFVNSKGFPPQNPWIWVSHFKTLLESLLFQKYPIFISKPSKKFFQRGTVTIRKKWENSHCSFFFWGGSWSKQSSECSGLTNIFPQFQTFSENLSKKPTELLFWRRLRKMSDFHSENPKTLKNEPQGSEIWTKNYVLKKFL